MKLVTMRLASYDWNKINANVVKIYEPIFFPSGSIQILSQFISWLNLDLGIKTCFFIIWILVVRHGYSLSFHPLFGLF